MSKKAPSRPPRSHSAPPGSVCSDRTATLDAAERKPDGRKCKCCPLKDDSPDPVSALMNMKADHPVPESELPRCRWQKVGVYGDWGQMVPRVFCRSIACFLFSLCFRPLRDQCQKHVLVAAIVSQFACALCSVNHRDRKLQEKHREVSEYR